jgi:deferrochelatase/peroxidase EfeB
VRPGRSDETGALLVPTPPPAHLKRIACQRVAFGRPLRPGADPTSPEGANAAFPNDRGLMLVFYQSSIHDKFEALQEVWKENASSQQYTITTGGDYFFSPSVDALAMLGGERSPSLRILNYWE